MAAQAEKVVFSLDEVLNQDIFGASDPIERPPDCLEEVKVALVNLAGEKGCENIDRFVNQCTQQVQALLDHHISDRATTAPLMSTRLDPAPLLRRECEVWLRGIHRRLSARPSVRNPYHGEINRDMPIELFGIISNTVRSLDGFVKPFCIRGENNKAIVISFTSVRLVNELFALLSGLSSEDVAGYFKRHFSGARKKGHIAAVIVFGVKDISLVFKKRPGKLVIQFNYGEWNAQWVCILNLYNILISIYGLQPKTFLISWFYLVFHLSNGVATYCLA